MPFFGRKKKSVQQTPPMRPRPSLPELAQAGQNLNWPRGLVDEQELQKSPPAEPVSETGIRSARKISFSQSRNVPFHRPFRPYASVGVGARGGDQQSEPQSPAPSTNAPSAYGNRVSGVSYLTGRSKARRPKQAPTFNIMVVGGQGTGKTSFLRLLLETADVAPSATMDQRADLEAFLAHRPKRTKGIKPVAIEITDTPSERLMLTVIDTPGLEFGMGRELVLEQQTNAIVREIDSRFAETLIEENKVIRSSKGDQHVHLIIYIIDPNDMVDSRHTTVQEPSPPNSAHPHSDDDTDATESDFETAAESQTGHATPRRKRRGSTRPKLTLGKGQLRVLRRLSAKVNVLPIVGHMDSMTEDRLAEVRSAIRSELTKTRIGFGVFAVDHETQKGSTPERVSRDRIRKRVKSEGHAPTADPDSDTDESGEGENDTMPEPVPPIPVVRIRSTKTPMSQLPRIRSSSRIRNAHSHINESDEEFDLARARASVEYERELDSAQLGEGRRRGNRMSYASAKFYDHSRQLLLRDLATESTGGHAGDSIGLTAAEREVDSLLPFAILNPERRSKKHNQARRFDPSTSTDGGDREETVDEASVDTETSLFTRKYRWGTIDVLNPQHCDFVPMRAAIFGSHLKALRTATKEAYERYRTEKLLVRKSLFQSREYGLDGVNGANLTLTNKGSWVDIESGAKLFSGENGKAQSSPPVKLKKVNSETQQRA